jgi:hypothetical protein
MHAYIMSIRHVYTYQIYIYVDVYAYMFMYVHSRACKLIQSRRYIHTLAWTNIHMSHPEECLNTLFHRLTRNLSTYTHVTRTRP